MVFNSTSDRALKDRIEDIEEAAVLATRSAFRSHVGWGDA